MESESESEGVGMGSSGLVEVDDDRECEGEGLFVSSGDDARELLTSAETSTSGNSWSSWFS